MGQHFHICIRSGSMELTPFPLCSQPGRKNTLFFPLPFAESCKLSPQVVWYWVADHQWEPHHLVQPCNVSLSKVVRLWLTHIQVWMMKGNIRFLCAFSHVPWDRIYWRRNVYIFCIFLLCFVRNSLHSGFWDKIRPFLASHKSKSSPPWQIFETEKGSGFMDFPFFRLRTFLTLTFTHLGTTWSLGFLNTHNCWGFQQRGWKGDWRGVYFHLVAGPRLFFERSVS